MFHPEAVSDVLDVDYWKMTVESCKHHHPAWYERITGQKADTDHESEPKQEGAAKH